MVKHIRDWDPLPLITAAICQALKDSQDREQDPLIRLDAVVWLASEAPLWLEGAGLSGEIGNLERAAKRLERTHYRGRAGVKIGTDRT